MKQSVYNLKNEVVSEVELSEKIFGHPLRTDVLSRVVEWQLAKRRSGSHSTKEIADVSGSTKKIVRQKGSGGARHGSKRAPQFRGGAVIFGPVNRDHGFSLPKKVRRMALRSILSEKYRAGELVVVDSFELPDRKTKTAKAVSEKLGLDSALIIDNEKVNDNSFSAFSNVKNVLLLPVIGANVYDIIRHKKLIVTVAAIKGLEARLA